MKTITHLSWKSQRDSSYTDLSTWMILTSKELVRKGAQVQAL